MIKAPFNFVPLSDKVFFPDWSDQISHDVPFSDGESGILDIKITAQTPIFVRNGHTPEDKEYNTSDYIEFSHTPDGRYFIPATSIKGMIRNVLEIASFGKMSHITKKRYSLRDLRLSDYTAYFRNHDIHCGWMTIDKSRGIAKVSDNGTPGRISPEDIDQMLGTHLASFARNGNTLRQERNRTAKRKYEQIGNRFASGKFSIIKHESAMSGGRIIVSPNHSGKQGKIVLTGQPGARSVDKRGKPTGKWYEFVFFDDVKKTFELDMEKEGGVYDDFCFIYEKSDDWKYLKTQSRIPVFFTLTKDGNSIEYMGLSYMFKLPYKKHINEFLNKEHLSGKRDLAECIFGTTETPSLKGRVQFSHAFCTSPNPQVCAERAPLMGSPKPTYYPIYTLQKGNDGETSKYKTFLDEDARLRGWKRYPVRGTTNTIPDVLQGQEQNTSPFKPLNEGTEFCFRIAYHNLRKSELGALLYAINLNDECLHSLGFCKPYGYGVVKLSISNWDKEKVNEYRNIFVDMMQSSGVTANFKSSPQINELKAMMMKPRNGLWAPLEYMNLPEFAQNKKRKDNNKFEFQQDYTNLVKSATGATSPQQSTNQEAVVRYVGGGRVTARLTSGKDMSDKSLNMNGKREKLRIGDKILVTVKSKGELLFIKKK